MEEVILSLGSNVGNRLSYLSHAVKQISNLSASPLEISSIYETEAWGALPLDPFLNLCLSLQTHLEPQPLILLLQEIEKSLGRESKNSGLSRTIDIDILFFGNRVIQQENLAIPHPRLQLRNFVLFPLVELRNNLWHPTLEKSILEIKNICPDQLTIHKTSFQII